MDAVAGIILRPLTFCVVDKLPAECVVSRADLANEAVGGKASIPDDNLRGRIHRHERYVPSLVARVVHAMATTSRQHERRAPGVLLTRARLDKVEVAQMLVAALRVSKLRSMSETQPTRVASALCTRGKVQYSF